MPGGSSRRPRAVCPGCRSSVAADRLDRDLKVCPRCRERIRREICAWLQQLVGLGLLAQLPEPRELRTDPPLPLIGS